MNIKSATYTGYEQGKGMFTYERAWELADALQCSLDELGGREWPPGKDALTSDETQLVDAYRECTTREQSSLLNMAQTMADDGQAKNDQVGGVA